MLSIVSKNLTKTAVFSNGRTFAAAALGIKSKQYPPSERKLRREKRKEERAQLVQHYQKLDEEANQSSFEKKWDYRLSLIVERQPIVFGQPPEWYTKFEEIRNQRRLDKVMPPVNKIAESIFNDNEEELVQEDKDAMEIQKLREANTSDITPADKANDRTSLLRNTPGFLYLLIHTPTGWTFPSIEFIEEKYKTTRLALERLAVSTYGKDMQLYFWGYPPCVHTARKYSESEQKKKNTFGEKMFYYRAARLIGDVALTPSVGTEFNWVSLKELPEYIKDENLISLLNRVLE